MKPEKSPTRASLALASHLLIVVLGGALATWMASLSDAYRASCFETNVCDSLFFRVAAELLNGGSTPYDAQIRAAHISATRLGGGEVPFDLPFQYPPNALPLFVVFAWVSPRVGHILFALVSTTVLLFSSLALVRERVQSNIAATGLLLGLSSSGSAMFNAIVGQTGALAASLVVGAVFFWTRAPLFAGLLLGVLTFKPQYALPLCALALVRGQRRILLGVLLSFLGLSSASALAFGLNMWTEFFRTLGQPNPTVPFMVNWMGLLWPLGVGHSLMIASAVPVFAVSLGLVFAVLWKFRDRVTPDGQVTIALCVTLVTSPNTHPYDLLVLLPALVHVASKRHGAVVGPVFFVLSWELLAWRWALALALLLFAGFCSYLSYTQRCLSPRRSQIS